MREPDVSVSDHGTIVMVYAHTQEAEAWVQEHTSPEGYQPYFPKAIIVEPRYLGAYVEGMVEDGLTVA